MSHQIKCFKGSASHCACGCSRRKNPRRKYAPGCNGERQGGSRPITSIKEPRNVWQPDPNATYAGVIDTVCSGFYFAALSQGGRCFIPARMVQVPLRIHDKVSVKLRLGREAATRQGAKWAATECLKIQEEQ